MSLIICLQAFNSPSLCRWLQQGCSCWVPACPWCWCPCQR